MSKEEILFFEFLKDYISEPNVPDYNGEYPQPYELTIEDAKLILSIKNKLDNIEKYIKDNYTNSDGSIWHTGFKDIYKIIKKRRVI